MNGNELHITRLVPAPVEEVYRAWTDPEVLMRWWGPVNTEMRDAQIDARPGGRYRFEMVGASGAPTVIAGEYVDVDPPHRLSFTWRFEAGGPGPQESHVTVELREVGDQTELVLTHGGFPDPSAAAPYGDGWGTVLPKLIALFD
jgi:uncharacterized protein YndB with AHSA1/START domain